MIRLLRVCQAYLVRDVLMTTSYRLAFVMQIASLGMSVFSLYFLSRLVGLHESIAVYGGYFPYSVVGLAVVGFFMTGFRSFSAALRNEQTMGTLEAMLMTPARISHIIIATSIWKFFWSLLTAVFTIGAAVLFFDISFSGNYAASLVLLVLTTITFSCLGILSASFIMVFKRGDPFGFFAGSLSFLLGGVAYPVEVLPGWLQKISQLLPITHGLRGIRDVLLAGQTFSDVVPQILILLVFVAIGVPVSLWVFRKSYNFARREGSLVHY